LTETDWVPVAVLPDVPVVVMAVGVTVNCAKAVIEPEKTMITRLAKSFVSVYFIK